MQMQNQFFEIGSNLSEIDFPAGANHCCVQSIPVHDILYSYFFDNIKGMAIW